jgi:AcrR family transcriptional regulator
MAGLRVLARNPGATLDDVVKESGVARATLFRHFPTRTDLVREVGVHAIEGLERVLAELDLSTGSASVQLDRLLEALVQRGEHLHFLFIAADLYEDPKLLEAFARVDKRIAPVLDTAREQGFLRTDVSREWFWAAAEALLYACWTEVARGTLARADAPRILRQTLLEGFAQRPAVKRSDPPEA